MAISMNRAAAIGNSFAAFFVCRRAALKNRKSDTAGRARKGAGCACGRRAIPVFRGGGRLLIFGHGIVGCAKARSIRTPCQPSPPPVATATDCRTSSPGRAGRLCSPYDPAIRPRPDSDKAQYRSRNLGVPSPRGVLHAVGRGLGAGAREGFRGGDRRCDKRRSAAPSVLAPAPHPNPLPIVKNDGERGRAHPRVK